MVRRVFLIRHCQSQSNVAGVFESRGDSPLTELGRAQAARLAASLADHGLSDVTLIASPLLRAAHTARAIADEHGWDIAHDHRFIEGDLGWMEGMTGPQVAAHLKEIGAEAVTHDIHGGETLDDVGERMLAALTDVLDQCEGVLVVVSHGYAIHGLLHRLDHPAESMLSNGDIVELHLDGPAPAHPPRRHVLGEA